MNTWIKYSVKFCKDCPMLKNRTICSRFRELSLNTHIHNYVYTYMCKNIYNDRNCLLWKMSRQLFFDSLNKTTCISTGKITLSWYVRSQDLSRIETLAKEYRSFIETAHLRKSNYIIILMLFIQSFTLRGDN